MAKSSAVPVRGLRTDASPEEQERAIIAAAIFEFSDVGVRRANIDVVARRAGVSRSTLYRRFPNKEELLAAALRETTGHISAQIMYAIEGLGPTQAITEAFRVALSEVGQNALLRRILTDESGMAATLFGFLGADTNTVLETFSTGVAKSLRKAGATMSDTDLRVASELLVRLGTSLLQAPSPAIDLSSDAAVIEFGEKFLAPLVW